jgi:hypothetical protein
MANLLAPGLTTAQVVFQGTSNLPTDRYVNTFHFRTVAFPAPPLQEAVEDEIVTRLTAFYNDEYGEFGIHTYLSVLIHREADTSQFRLYDMGEAEPREPHVHTWTLDAASSGGRQPQEAALCASFYGDRNIPRQRGRVYIGPFENHSTDGATARPTTALQNTVKGAMQALADSNGLCEWVTLHHTSLVAGMHPVTAGWVDNEWDTQRRRGLKATSRVTWGS